MQQGTQWTQENADALPCCRATNFSQKTLQLLLRDANQDLVAVVLDLRCHS